MSADRMDPREPTAEASVPGQPEQVTDTPDRDRRSVRELIREVAGEGSELVRQEIALARAEMQEKLEAYRSATASMAVGGALLFAGLLTLLWAVNIGLTALLAQWMGVDVAVWLAPVILAVVLGAVGYAFLKGGQSSMRREGITPEKTRHSLERDRSWARSRARRFRTEARHE